MAQANLVLHCGAREVSREQLALVPCPPPEGRWKAVPHVTVLDYATTSLKEAGYEIENVKLGLTRDDNRFFGVMTLKTPLVTGTSLAVGRRDRPLVNPSEGRGGRRDAMRTQRGRVQAGFPVADAVLEKRTTECRVKVPADFPGA